ncbi:hypothetical protein Rsub_03708 [Raphidocelis subcapitata]|uniref:Uncharacterized protein n=1 Tax=Raphidocelis subcapitata TaxID=307507 RepID=A0A2V0NT97_9CHLO|nr:hypothetical protein Rsub_03708 [Raphidocelis subcapitata]|eukprot:GBF90854.1 hypothetical protein Rsub_03708 [Raphidocelis subcapitata]
MPRPRSPRADATPALERLRRKLAAAAAAGDGDGDAEDGGCGCDGSGGGGGFIRAAAAPAPEPAAASAAALTSDLKTYLEAVVEADRAGDALLASITQQHCIGAAVAAVNAVEDGALPQGKGTHALLELASSTLCALSQRPFAHPLLLSAGAVPPLVSLLSPAHTTCAAANAACALGNLAANAAARRAVRAHGGVGALVRLLRPDAPGGMQAAAASALCLMAARDTVVQDSVRYLGGIDLLVDLLAAPRASVARVARYCLASLQHGNPRNEADILQAVRTSPALAKDFSRLRDAVAALSPDGGDAGGASGDTAGAGRAKARAAARAAEAAAEAGAAAADGGEEEEADESDEWGEEEGEEAQEGRRARALRSRVRRSADALDRRLARANEEAASALIRAAAAGRVRAPPRRPARAAEAAAAAAEAAAAAVEAAAALSPRRHRPAAKSQLGKHLLQFSCSELCGLLGEMGFDAASDLRALRRGGTTGAELLAELAAASALGEPGWASLGARLGLPPHRARRLRRLADAAALFDAVAARAGQGRISEIELRLWLAGSGCSPSEVERVLRLLRRLVARGDGGAQFLTFWEFAAGWPWVTHALEAYGVDWRGAL